MRSHNNLTYYTMITLFATAIILLCTHMFLSHSGNSLAVKPSAQTKNYAILIDTNEKRLYLLCNGKLLKQYKCAVGKSSTPSPLGNYKITQKSNWGEGFGGHWLGINCIWGDYGIHGTRHPETIGTAASHGCFRMYNSDVEELYKIVPYGTPVCITGGCFGAFGNGSRIISPYMYGLDVQVVQKRLKELGYFNGYCSGIYDSADFKSAIHKFQKENGLTVSDNINRKTLNAMGFVMME
jgi:hypothetical protein